MLTDELGAIGVEAEGARDRLGIRSALAATEGVKESDCEWKTSNREFRARRERKDIISRGRRRGEKENQFYS